MTPPCVVCGSTLMAGPRSPYCPPCWNQHQRDRRLNNVHAFRQRARDEEIRAQAAREQAAREAGLPATEDLVWLNQLGLGLAEPMVEVVNWLRAGHRPPQPDLMGHIREAVRRYDLVRTEFDRLVAQRPDSSGKADVWRGAYEDLRGLLK